MLIGGGQCLTVFGSIPSLYIATLTSVILSLVRLSFNGFCPFVRRAVILVAVFFLLFVEMDGIVAPKATRIPLLVT